MMQVWAAFWHSFGAGARIPDKHGQTPVGFGERFQARLSLQLHSDTLRSCEAGDEFEVSPIDSFLVCSNASHSLRSLREEFK